ncbi:hypothetical protein [Serratia marcescens]|uniref:hypothetical protein n=1 Tax=Serratia marcescens TaxID=615 RepID=UPI000AD6DFF4|nr:hypothetical protein [Serratia marcescens]
MEILELIRLVSNPLNKISVDIISGKSTFDYLLLSAPTVIGILALIVSYCSIKTAASTQRESSLTQARIEIATKLKYDRLNAMTDLASELIVNLDAFMMLSVRLKSQTEAIKHRKDNLKEDVSDSIIRRASLFNEVVDKLRDVKKHSYKLQLLLDTKIHGDIFFTLKRIDEIVNKDDPYGEVKLFSELVVDLSRKIYVILAEEWRDIQDYPFDRSQ